MNVERDIINRPCPDNWCWCSFKFLYYVSPFGYIFSYQKHKYTLELFKKVHSHYRNNNI